MKKIEKPAVDARRKMVLLANYKKANNPEGFKKVLTELANMEELDFRAIVAEASGVQGGAN